MNAHQVTAIGLGLILGVTGADAADEASPETLLAVNISGETLGVILEQLYSQYGYTFIYSPELGNRDGPHLTVAPLPARRAFAILAAAYGGCAQVRDTLVVFVPCREDDQSRGAPALDPAKVALGVAVEDAKEPTKGNVRGVAVTDIFNEGPAYRAGIRAGDVILSYDGTEVSGAAHLRSLVGRAEPGDVALVTVLRGSERNSFNVQF